MSSISGTGATGSTSTNFVPRDEIGFAGLTADDFMKMLIAELQNQDPSEPVSNADLMSQLSMMRNLTASDELNSTLQTMTSNQVLADASSFIGKTVIGRSVDGVMLEGEVSKAFTSDGDTYIEVDGKSMLFTDVESVSA